MNMAVARKSLKARIAVRYRYIRVYTTLNQSVFWIGTNRDLMADFATINACISSTTFVELIFSELCLSLVPRVVAFRARCSFLVL